MFGSNMTWGWDLRPPGFGKPVLEVAAVRGVERDSAADWAGAIRRGVLERGAGESQGLGSSLDESMLDIVGDLATCCLDMRLVRAAPTTPTGTTLSDALALIREAPCGRLWVPPEFPVLRDTSVHAHVPHVRACLLGGGRGWGRECRTSRPLGSSGQLLDELEERCRRFVEAALAPPPLFTPAPPGLLETPFGKGIGTGTGTGTGTRSSHFVSTADVSMRDICRVAPPHQLPLLLLDVPLRTSDFSPSTSAMDRRKDYVRRTGRLLSRRVHGLMSPPGLLGGLCPVDNVSRMCERPVVQLDPSLGADPLSVVSAPSQPQPYLGCLLRRRSGVEEEEIYDCDFRATITHAYVSRRPLRITDLRYRDSVCAGLSVLKCASRIDHGADVAVHGCPARNESESQLQTWLDPTAKRAMLYAGTPPGPSSDHCSLAHIQLAQAQVRQVAWGEGVGALKHAQGACTHTAGCRLDAALESLFDPGDHWVTPFVLDRVPTRTVAQVFDAIDSMLSAQAAPAAHRGEGSSLFSTPTTVSPASPWVATVEKQDGARVRASPDKSHTDHVQTDDLDDFLLRDAQGAESQPQSRTQLQLQPQPRPSRHDGLVGFEEDSSEDGFDLGCLAPASAAAAARADVMHVSASAHAAGPAALLVSERVAEELPTLLAALQDQYGVRCFDCPLASPIDVVVDRHTAVALLPAEGYLDRSAMTDFIKLLSIQAFKYTTVWILLLDDVEEPSSAEAEARIKFMHSLSNFPARVVVRSIFSDGRRGGLRSADREVAAHVQRARGARAEWPADAAHMSSVMADAWDINTTFRSKCEYLQLFPTMNFFLAVELLCRHSLRQLHVCDMDTVQSGGGAPMDTEAFRQWRALVELEFVEPAPGLEAEMRGRTLQLVVPDKRDVTRQAKLQWVSPRKRQWGEAL